MRIVLLSVYLLMLTVMTLVSPAEEALGEPAASATDPAVRKKFNQAVEQTESLLLPINKVVLYRQAATALIQTDKPRAVMLLKRALSDLDAAEANRKSRSTQDDETFQLLEFHRLPVLMLMERIDPVEACNVLASKQTADDDLTFQTIFLERLKNPEMVRQVALRKLDHGVTPASVAAYGVLKKQDPDVARSLAAAIVLKLTKTDAGADTQAVRSAFLLTHLLRSDVGALAPEMIIDPSLLSPDALRDLFTFLGDAFLASKDPEDLILGSRPDLYTGALETYALDRAEKVKLLPFAAPGAKSKLMTAEAPVFDANHPDPSTLTPEQGSQRAALRSQVEARMKESNGRIAALTTKANQDGLSEKDHEDAVLEAVDQANSAISLARTNATVLNREAFQDGEVEFYTPGDVTGLIDRVSMLLQMYALKDPSFAEKAASRLDGHEVQTQVSLGIAIRELTGGQPYLVPPAKAPAIDGRGASLPTSSKPPISSPR